MNANLNKTEINLISAGTGMLFFGLWTFIKISLSYLIFGMDQYIRPEDEVYRTPIIITTWAITVLLTLLYCYIGLTARGEGKGKRKSVFYLILIGFMLLVRTLVITLEILAVFFSETGKFTLLVTVIVDITAFFMLLEIMINSAKLRSLREQLKLEEGAYEH